MNSIKKKITRIKYCCYRRLVWISISMMKKHLLDTDLAVFKKWTVHSIEYIKMMIKHSRI